MDRKYRVVSRAILATAMIVPDFIATKVAAEKSRMGIPPLIVQTIITMLTILEWL